MVRLITHNLLSCPSKLCSYPTNFPLQFRNVSRIELIDQDFNEDFVRGFLSRLEWHALCTSAQQLGDTSLPTERPDFDDPQAVPLDLIQKLHHVLLEVSPTINPYEKRENPKTLALKPLTEYSSLHQIVVMDGEMVCPSPACGHIFLIKDSIPNMLLAEHEIRK
ncbi:BQ5605_C010g06198 [Microbotryum silenes-dioicae]|uniref:BQ5605_C010g06198 protein n=1 Tax=Microbotryum silenes-dioicae TaxID=796604 RepID=A0A2X0LU34_9BASI|nr:BQ5605_C010g06198 [Microbotryum silenes-dioicae]